MSTPTIRRFQFKLNATFGQLIVAALWTISFSVFESGDTIGQQATRCGVIAIIDRKPATPARRSTFRSGQNRQPCAD